MLLGLSIMLLDPEGNLPGRVPGSIVPDSDEHLLALVLEAPAKPPQELGREISQRPAFHETEHNLVRVTPQEPVASDSVRVWVVRVRLEELYPHWGALRPSVDRWPRQS